MNIGLPEMLLLLVVAVLLLGSRALPELGRRFGRLAREIEEVKRELSSIEDEEVGFRETNETLLVFLSSAMNARDDLHRERAIIKSLLSHHRLFSLWRFEDAPADDELEASYLDKVRECHLFLLIVGSTLSPAVYKEFETAREAKKPILVFLKKVEQTPEVAQFIGALTELQLRYKVFSSEEELRREVLQASYNCVVKYYKRGLTQKAYLACLALLLALEESEADIETILESYRFDSESLASLQRVEQSIASDAGNREFLGFGTNELWYQWDLSYFKAKDFRTALRLARELVRTEPERPFFLLCLAWTHEALGERNEAIQIAYNGYKKLASKIGISESEKALKIDFLRWARYWTTGRIEHLGSADQKWLKTTSGFGSHP